MKILVAGGGFSFGGSGDKTQTSKPPLFGASTPNFSFPTSSSAPATGPTFGTTTTTPSNTFGFAGMLHECNYLYRLINWWNSFQTKLKISNLSIIHIHNRCFIPIFFGV